MSVLLDTNILTRSAQPGHPMHNDALDALDTLRKRGEDLCVIPQNLYEFWVVATRPVTVNGLGMTVSQAEAEVSSIKRLFRFLNDIPGVYTEWERLVSQYAVAGRNAHDARLVAAMMVHGIAHLLTFNAGDFKRFSGITVLAPADVLNRKLPPQPTNEP
jgi:predicted nucleic acid-binding protein